MGSGSSTGNGNPTHRARGRSRNRRRRAARRPLARILLPGAALSAIALGAGAAVAHFDALPDGRPRAGGGARTPAGSLSPEPDETPQDTDTGGPDSDRSRPADPSVRPSSPARPKKPAPKPEPVTPPSQKQVTPSEVPVSGPGTFTAARSAGSPVGTGPLRRYRVQVENGIAVSATDAAAEIERILAHPQSWAAHGRGSFQLVADDADFVIRIATPATADRLCGKQGLDTGGELNCETADGVVVNLRRWMLGSPTFAGTAAEYRHLIINHEVGHEIGIRKHMGCPGDGEPAPVMMQQIKGLDGCRSNAWPYDGSGTYLTGPVID